MENIFCPSQILPFEKLEIQKSFPSNLRMLSVQSYVQSVLCSYDQSVGYGHYTIARKVDGVWKLYSDDKVYLIGNDAVFVHTMRSNIYGVPYMVLGEHK